MSRFTQNYGGPPNTHPHAGANNSSIINRQTTNVNKYEKTQPQTNSNKYDQNQPQLSLANVSSQQQQQLQQQQKTKLVNTEFTMPVAASSHQHGGPLSHNNFRIHQPNSNYNVTSQTVNYSQSVPPQPSTAHQPSERQSVCQIGQQPTQASQQAQDHKMQQQSSQPTYHTNHGFQQPVRGQRYQQQTRPNNLVPRHASQPQNQNVGQQFFYLAPLPYFNGNNSGYMQTKPAMYNCQMVVSTPRTVNSQHMPHMSAANTPIQTHQHNALQLPHMQMPQMSQIISMPRPPQTTEAKRYSKRIPIIDPETNDEVRIDKDSNQNSSGTNTHSSALKIEAPSSVQSSNQSQPQNQKTLNEPLCDTTSESQKTTSDHSNAEVQMESSNVDEPPHTPVVSAIADGPSVDITPKQSKNIKRSNKSPEWPSSLAEKPISNNSTCDNYSKVASSLTNTTSSSSSEWVKHNQSAPKVSSENELKDSHQKHNPRSKHSSNQNATSQSTKGKGSHQIDTGANMVSNLQQSASASTKEQVSIEPVLAIEQTTTENLNNNRNSEKAKSPQQLEKVLAEGNLKSTKQDKLTENSANINVNVPRETAEAAALPNKLKPVTSTSIDETDKIINSFDSMSVSSAETNIDKIDKLDTKSNKLNNNSQKSTISKVDEPSKSIESKNNEQILKNASGTIKVSITANSGESDKKTVQKQCEIESKANDKMDGTKASNTNSNNDSVETIINNNLPNSITQTTPITISQSAEKLINITTVPTATTTPTATAAAAALATIATSTETAAPAAPAATPQQIINKDSENNVVENLNEKITEKPQQAIEKLTTTIAKPKLIINYEEGQWSPMNTDGKKCYNRQQMLTLRESDAAQTLPQIEDTFALIRKNSPSNSNKNNNKNQSSSSNNRNAYTNRPSSQGGSGGNQQMSQGGGKGSKSGMIHLNLSLREDVKLNESANAWKPTFCSTNTSTISLNDLNNIDVLCKRVRGILNKLTPEKFEPLLDQLQALNLNTSEKVSNVISLVFEKAIDEPNFSAAYAQLCQKLSKPIEEKEEAERRSSEETAEEKNAPPSFKKELLNKCQKEFTIHVANENSIQSKLLPLETEKNQTADSNRKIELKAQIDEEERKLRRRSVGTVRFIGELYRQNMLLSSIMEWCVTTLLNFRNDEKLECLCKLLTTVGQKMEEKTFDEEYNKKNYRDLTPHFQTMQNIANDKKQSKISSRVRFMLLDVIELRKNRWVPRRVDLNPKKMGQIQKEVQDEHYKNQILSNMPNSGMGNNNGRKDNRDRNDRGNMPRGGSMSNSGYNNNNKMNRSNFQDNDGWIQQGSNKNRGNNNNTQIDSSKFRGNSTVVEDIAKLSLGTSKQFQWKHNAPPAITTTVTNSFSALESDPFKPIIGNRSKELYPSKGSMERERDGPTRSGSQHSSRDNSAGRNSCSSRSLPMRPPQMQYNTLQSNSNSSSTSQRVIRSDNKLNNQSLSSSTTSLSTSNLPSSASITPSSSDPKLSEEISDETTNVIRQGLRKLLFQVQNDEITDYDAIQGSTALDKIDKAYRWAAVRELHNMAVDIPGLTEAKRCFIGTICRYWIDKKGIKKQDYVRGVNEYFTYLSDLIIDVPKIYEWTAQMISAAFENEMLTINDLKNTPEESRTKLLAVVLNFLAYEYGPQYVRDLWKRSKCKWENIVTDGNINQFIDRNKLKFVDNLDETLPPITSPISSERFSHRINQLIRKDGFSEREIDEYIKIHVPTINKQGIRLLTKTLIGTTLDKSKAGYIINDDILPRSINILKMYVGGEKNESLQLEALYAIQLLSNKLEHPSGFLIKVFNKLYEIEVIPSSVFKQWEESDEEPLGKGVAVKNLRQFLKCVGEDFDSDEEDAK